MNIVYLVIDCLWYRHLMVQNKEDLNRGKGYIKKFCKSLKEHSAETINFVKKKMIPLTKKELKSHASK